MKLTEVIEKIELNKADQEFLPTGFKTLDRFLDGGFLRKELIVLGGFTGVGKSFFAGQIFYSIARSGFKTGYFSLEISNEMVVSRLIGAISNIKPTRIMTGYLDKNEFEKKSSARGKLLASEDYMEFYDDLYGLDEIKKKILEDGLEFVIVDFVQNIFVKGMNEEYTRLNHITLDLQKFAKENNCCIVILSQLSNQKGREGSKGNIEYKGSGSIATVCDLGFFIERAEITGDKNYVNLVLKKNRRGISGMVFEFEFKHPGGWISEYVKSY